MYSFISISQKPYWLFYDLKRLILSLSKFERLRKIMSEIKQRPKYEIWYKNSFDRYKESKNNKNQKQINHELFQLMRYWGVFPYQYFRYDMFLKSCSLTLDQMKDYVPEHVMYFWFYPKVNGKDHIKYSNKKYLTLKFAELEIPAPEVYFFYENERYYDLQNKEITAKNAFDLLPDNADFVNKPFDGAGGKDISFFSKFDIDPASMSSNLINNSLVQQKVVNSNEINAIHPESLNTIRIVTSTLNGKPEVIFAFLRVGIGNSKFDNIHQGGLFVGIDIQKGELMSVGYDGKMVEHEFHPDTLIRFDSLSVPGWEDVKKLVIYGASHFDQLKIIGWDIALTPDGPLAVEINSIPGITFMHTCYGGIRQQFNINPKIL